MSDELKPCPNPWCEALERDGDYSPQIQYSNFAMVYVACTSCSMAGPTRQHEHEAIAAWNTRTDTAKDARIAELEVVALAVARFDGRNNNAALKAMARAALNTDERKG